MKMNNRLLSLILVVVMILGMFPLSAIATDENHTHEVTHIEGCSAECAVEGCACTCHVPAHIEGCSAECAVEGCTCTCHQPMFVSDDPAKACTQCDGIFAEDGVTVVHNPTCPTRCSCTPVDGVHVAPCVFAVKEDAPCEKCNAVKNADGTIKHETTCEKVQYVPTCTGKLPCSVEGCTNTHCTGDAATCPIAECECKKPLCDKCKATKDGETIVHEENCLSKCKCEAVIEGVHSNWECPFYVKPVKTLSEKLLEINNLSDLLIEACKEENYESILTLTADEVTALRARAEALYAAGDASKDDLDGFLAILDVVSGEEEKLPEEPVVFADNVHNVTQNKWYSTLSAATVAANASDVIEVHNSFTETTHVKIQKNGLIIRAASGKTPVISWQGVDTTPGDTLKQYATQYNCVVVYSSVSGKTTLGGGTGTLTIDASGASSDSYKGRRARVLIHVGSGTLELLDGIVLTGGNPGGGNYNTKKEGEERHPAGSGEITGERGFGAGIFMYSGTLNMKGGIIRDNYSLLAKTSDIEANNSHNFVGGGGGVYLHNNTTMNMTGGTITLNAAGSGGGGGILVGHSATLNLSGGTISKNVTRAASGGGIGVRIQSYVSITGGNLIDNYAVNYGGGLFARGDSTPLSITGGLIEGNTAGGSGGGVLFWTVGDNVEKNTVIIGGDVQIKDNRAENGAGVSVGREVLDGKPIGSKTKLVIQGNPVISDNIATQNGGGIHMQSDTFGNDVNIVEVSGGTISGNSAVDGGGIYIPGGTVTVTGGTFSNNMASEEGAGIFTAGGTLTISNATFSENKATEYGGGAYVVGGSVIMNSGTFSGNTAKSGGGIYITKEGTTNESNFTMNGGAFSKNQALSENGGAAYVNGGSIFVTDGLIDNNTAANNGGGLYITGGSFTMTSGSMTNNKATGTEGAGGGAYVEGGNVEIGIKTCTGNGNYHTVPPRDKNHPTIEKNTATDSGGGIALIGSGYMSLYCGKITNNIAGNDGRGLNVYMEDGTFNFHAGTVGQLQDPELVIVGGTLKNHTLTEGDVTLTYYHCNDLETFEESHTGDLANKTATASKGSWFNLPDGEKYWDAPEGYRFFGWTFKGPEEAQSHVRKKSDYQPMGEPLQGYDTHDKTADDVLHMYALWAPETSSITYVGSYFDGSFTSETLNASNVATYSFHHTEDSTITLNSPEKPGYTFVGWFYYQDVSQNANWGIEPAYVDTGKDYGDLDFKNTDGKAETIAFLPVADDGKCYLEVEATNFGDLTLIAKFEQDSAQLNYVVVGPEGTTPGTVDPTSETILVATENTANGSTATAEKHFRFVGWYSDENCTNQVSTELTYAPTKENDALWIDGTTFYAKFEWDLTDMMISKTVSGNVYDEDDIFRFVVEDDTGAEIARVTLKHGESVTIKDVTVGKTYTVTELSSGNRYTGAVTKDITIDPPEATNEVSFTNTANENKWLSATAVKKNEFEANTSVLKQLFGN